jgi:hypothetical protein
MNKNMIAALAGVALMSASAARADADDALLKGYVLTDAKVKAWQATGQALQASTDPAVKKEAQNLDNMLGGSIAQGLAKVKASPHVEALIHQHGLTDNDFVMIPSVLMVASMAAAAPGAAAKMPVSAGNIAFVKAHGAELKGMSAAH